MQETPPFDSWVGKIRWRREKATHSGNLASRTSPWGRNRQTGLSDFHFNLAFLVAQIVKNLPSMQEVGIQSWVGKTLEKEMATHSIFLAGESHGQRSLAGYSPWGCKELDTTL